MSWIFSRWKGKEKGKGKRETNCYGNLITENVASTAGEKSGSELETKISSSFDNFPFAISASMRMSFVAVVVCQKEVNSVAVLIAGGERFSKVVNRYSKRPKCTALELCEFISSVVVRVYLEQQLHVQQHTPETMLHALLLGNQDERIVFSPMSDLTCLTLCREYPLEERVWDYAIAKNAKKDTV